MTVMEFRTGGPPPGPRGAGVLAGLRERLGRCCGGPAADAVGVPAPRPAPEGGGPTRGGPTG